jgi:hypothetical protein
LGARRAGAGPVVAIAYKRPGFDKPLYDNATPQAEAAGVPQWLPMATAPKDGTACLLLIEGGEHPLEDESPSVSIGSYGVEGGPQDDPTWHFAGWSWHQDCYCRGSGTPVGWMPLPAARDSQAPAAPLPTEQWHIAVDEALVNAGLDCTMPESDPRACVKALIDWHVTLATDPRISDAAPLPDAPVDASQLVDRLKSLRVVLGIDSPETRGWAPAVQREARRVVDDAVAALSRPQAAAPGEQA